MAGPLAFLSVAGFEMTSTFRVPTWAGIVAMALLAGCGPGAEHGRQTLTLAVRADVTGFFPNPPTQNESYTFDVNRSIYDGLVAFDSLLRMVPGLADRWDTPDDRTYVLRLRPGLRFSDGRPVTSADVAASMEAALRYGWSSKDYLQPIESIAAVDPRHVRIRTRGSNLVLLSRLPWGFVLPHDAVHASPVPVIGTGPYRLESWSPGREIVFVRNPYHWGPAPAFPRARFVVVPDGATRVAMVEKGEADIADNAPLEMLERLERSPDLRVVARSGHRVLFLGLRVDRPPFSDPRVRRAIGLALDRGELIRRALHGRGEVATQLVPASIVGHNPEIPLTVPDRAQARSLLRAAGLRAGSTVRLDGPSNRYVNDTEILREVARQLAEVGLPVEAVARDKREHFERLSSGASDFYLLGWASETGDAGDALEFLAHTADGMRGRLNSTGLADPKLDRLIDAADRSGDVAGRLRLLQQALARVAGHQCMIPLVVQTQAVVHSARLAWAPPLNLSVRPEHIRPVRP